MAEIRTEREGMPTRPRSDLHAAENLGDRPADGLPAGHALPGGTPTLGDDVTVVRRTDAAGVVSDDPEAVRSEIEQTRERMSSTIDEIESVLARKKEQIQDRLDVLSPVRERPLAATGIAFGVGLALGLITGGGDDDDSDDEPHYPRTRRTALGMGAAGMGMGSSDDDDDVYSPSFDHGAAERAAMWESRARRLLRVAQEQEDKIRELQERYGTLYTREMELAGWEDDEAASNEVVSSIASLRDNVLHGITGFLTEAFQQMGKGSAAGGTSHA
ncbi:MAG: DUF3618 domain-containing protein [Gemmatimonadota bacterium]